jgi:hypothetical protein
VFSLMDRQFGFCLDLALEYSKVFGTDDVSSLIRDESLARIDEARRSTEASERAKKQAVEVTLFRRVGRKVKRVLFQTH